MLPKSKKENFEKSFERTKIISVKKDEDTLMGRRERSRPFPTTHYQLHIDPPVAETGRVQTDPIQKDRDMPVRHVFSRKIWNTLEWLGVSALIFMLLFFILNFSAYSTLFVSKFNRLRGDFQANPFAQNLFPSAQNAENQQPLPLTTNAVQSKKQTLPLNLEIAPPDDRIIIPRINRNVPIIRAKSENLIKRDWNALEKDLQEALRNGVVQYPGTANPGENGNVVVTGHSSYFAWDPGRFKDVFALLHEVAIGDKIIIYYQQKKYIYQVYDIKVVLPDQVEILTQKGENRLTLLTCTPVGTNLKRLIVFARPVLP